MADIITTEYDDDSGNDFIQCEYCDKSIRGDTQYRIHLTTNQHLKKKESMNLKDDMPVWENFLDYLDYLRLDEPIIGLSALEQLESQVLGNGQFRLKYKCRMCSLEADLPAMASHVVGRKHRQKFLELRRPDLVTWDKFSINQQGKVIRAKAEVVERQEGRGVPLDLHSQKPRNSKWNGPRRDGAPPNPRFQNQRQNMGPQQGGLDQDYLIYDPPGLDIPPQNFPEDPRYQEKPVDDDYYSASAYRRGADYPEDAPHQRGYPEENGRFRPSFPESDDYGQQYPRDNHHEEPYQEDRRRLLPDEPLRQAYDKGDRYEPSYYGDDPQGRSQPGDDHQRPYVDDRHSGQRYPDRDLPHRTYQDSQAQAYQEKEPPHQHTDYNHGKRLYSERDGRGYSYPQVDHRQPAVSEDYGQAYPEEDVYHRRDQEDVGRGIYSRPYNKDESSEWHPKVDTDRRFHGHEDDKHYTERGFEPHHSSQDYRSERGYSGFDTERNRGGEARYGGEMPESRMDRDQAGARGPRLRVSEIQERPGSHEESGSTRKRRSRFTDCTEAERELLQKYQMAQAVSQKLVQNPPMKVKRRSESAHLRKDYREHGGAQQDPGNVLDVLKDVQIESVEEANFLKNKLCSLLKEFQANKSGPRGASPLSSRDYEQPRKEVQERPRSEEYSYQMREMAAAERDHEIRQPPLSVDYNFHSREMSAAERGYDEMQKQPLYGELNYPRREIPDVGRGPDNFRQVSPERFDRRSYERDQPWRRGKTSRPAEMFESFPRDDLNRGEYRSPPQEDSLRFCEGSQRPYYDGPFEEDPRDFHPHSIRTSFDEERRNPPSNLDKIASTLLQLVAHK